MATAVGLIVVATPLGALTSPARAAATECAPPADGAPILVTARCVDPEYDRPVIDRAVDRARPVPHRKVSGHFEGTTATFNIYLPPKDQWNGRFFQAVYPTQGDVARDDPDGGGTTTAGSIAFGAASGGYTVQTNGSSGYRVDAAAAKFSKKVAADYYSTDRRIYGYNWGGSGGSYLAISAAENTQGVWDGTVPYVIGTPMAIPNYFFIRAFARFVLVHEARHIGRAVAPGGSGRPYSGLSRIQRKVLHEVSKLGIPLRGWEDYRYTLGLDDPTGLLGFLDTVRAIDPTYVDDFWSKPGYLGTARTPLGKLFRANLVDDRATVTRVASDAQGVPTSVTLESVPSIPKRTAPRWLDFTVYAADGITVVGTLPGSLDPETRVLTVGDGASAEVLAALRVGAQLRIDNRWYLAGLSYHRHQIPVGSDLYPWDQYLDASGEPRFPQRPVDIGQLITGSITGGGSYTGQITGKMIIVDNLLDVDAYPWGGDWYARRVHRALGDRFGRTFRLYYNDNADHIVGPARTHRLVPYDGMLEQALRDVARWAEKGIAPPGSTRYDVVNGQVRLPGSAKERRGIQPVVHLTANGRDRTVVNAGEHVELRGRITTPRRAGRIVDVAWDLSGSGNFEERHVSPPRRAVHLHRTVTFAEPGTHYVALRTSSQRRAVDATSPFARVQDLDRVRVVVLPAG